MGKEGGLRRRAGTTPPFPIHSGRKYVRKEVHQHPVTTKGGYGDNPPRPIRSGRKYRKSTSTSTRHRAYGHEPLPAQTTSPHPHPSVPHPQRQTSARRRGPRGRPGRPASTRSLGRRATGGGSSSSRGGSAATGRAAGVSQSGPTLPYHAPARATTHPNPNPATALLPNTGLPPTRDVLGAVGHYCPGLLRAW